MPYIILVVMSVVLVFGLVMFFTNRDDTLSVTGLVSTITMFFGQCFLVYLMYTDYKQNIIALKTTGKCATSYCSDVILADKVETYKLILEKEQK